MTSPRSEAISTDVPGQRRLAARRCYGKISRCRIRLS